MATRHLRIHGDNIIECERSLSLLSKSLNVIPKYIETSPTYMPMYMLGSIQVDLLSGHGRWGVDISEALAKNGGILREGADSYITEITDDHETIIFALEYCSALPAGNNAWQRNGRAYASALANVPYLYMAEIGGVELDDNRQKKAPRFPNPVVPFSYLMLSKRLQSFCLPEYMAHPSITDSLYKKYSNVFGLDECLQIIKALINGTDYSELTEALTGKAISMVKLLADDRRSVDTLCGVEWDNLLNSKDSAIWLQKNTRSIIWKKKIAGKVVTTPTFSKLFTRVLSYDCATIGANDLPICIIPDNKRKDFETYLGKLYPSTNFSFDKGKPLVIVWITGFKPRGDDSRPDRGLAPLAKMLLGNDAQIMAVVYGRVLHGKQAVVEACFGIKARVALHPVDSGFGLAVAALGARLGSGVVGGIDGGDITLGIFLAARGLDDIRRLETHLTPARAETEEVLVRLLEEVATLDIEFAGELHLARTEFGMPVDVLRSDGLAVALIVGDSQFHGGEDSADTRSRLFQALAHGVFEETDINHSLHLGVSDTVDERKENAPQ